jgi:hypothetical protein
MDLEDLLDALLALDPHVRKVGVIRYLEGSPLMKTRPGLVEVLLDKEDQLKIIFSIVIDSFRQFEGETGVGPLHLTAIYYRDLYFLLFPYGRYVVGVSCDPGPVEEITRKFIDFIERLRAGEPPTSYPEDKVTQPVEA